MNRWNIVQFVEDGTVEAVPSTWLVDGYCHWPSLPYIRLTNTIKKCEPANNSWEKHEIKVFSNDTFDDYEKAKAKAKVVVDTSDLQSEVETQKRKRSMESAQLLNSDDDIDDSDSILPPLSVLKRKRKLVTRAMEVTENTPTIHQETPPSSSDSVVEKYLKTIIEQQHALRALISDVLTRVEAIENHLKQKPTSFECRTSIFEKDMVFPLSTDEELQKLEMHLQNEDNFKDTIHELANIGGGNNYNFVKRVMTSLISNDLAMQYSWLGKKGKKKFYTTKVAKAVLDAAEKAKLCRDRKETEVSIQSWLRRAAERNKNNGKDL